MPNKRWGAVGPVVAMSFDNLEEAADALDNQLSANIAVQGRTLLMARLPDDRCHAMLHLYPEEVHKLLLAPYHVRPSRTAWIIAHQPVDAFTASLLREP